MLFEARKEKKAAKPAFVDIETTNSEKENHNKQLPNMDGQALNQKIYTDSNDKHQSLKEKNLYVI